MAKLPIATTHLPVDMETVARNWETDVEGTARRQGNSTMAPFLCASEINTCLGAEPRCVFCTATPIESALATAEGADPLYQWTSKDGIYNARLQGVHIVAVPRILGTESSYSYAMRYGHTEYSRYATSIESGYPSTAVNQFEDVFEASYVFNRGARATNGWHDGLSTFNGYTILSVVVQDEPYTELDTANQIYCNTSLLLQGAPVLADINEQIRTNMVELRNYSLPVVFAWSAQGLGAVDGDSEARLGVYTTSTSYVNLLDQSVTTRTATSPGVLSTRIYAGKGLSVSTAVTCRVWAEATTNDATVKFIGPSHVASNETEITVPADAGGHWYGNDTNIIYLNSNIAATDVTTARNKIDVHIKAGASGTLIVRNATAYEIDV